MSQASSEKNFCRTCQTKITLGIRNTIKENLKTVLEFLALVFKTSNRNCFPSEQQNCCHSLCRQLLPAKKLFHIGNPNKIVSLSQSTTTGKKHNVVGSLKSTQIPAFLMFPCSIDIQVGRQKQKMEFHPVRVYNELTEDVSSKEALIETGSSL